MGVRLNAVTRPPAVSVIMPAYNSEAFIAESVRSVLDQTFDDLELIVVDDGSTDNTVARLAEFGDPRLKLVQHDSNRGVSAAGNTGFRASTGTFVGCIGSDDVWLPTKLAEQMALIERDPAIGVVYTWLGLIDAEGRIAPNVEAPDLDDDPIAALAAGRCRIITSVLVRREEYARHGWLDTKLAAGEDWDLLLRLAVAGLKFRGVRKPLVYCRVRFDSLSHDPANAEAVRAAFEKLESLFLQHRGRLTPKVMGGAAFRSAQWSIGMEHPRNAIQFIRKSLAFDWRITFSRAFVREMFTLLLLAGLPRPWYRSLRSRFSPDATPRNAPLLTLR
ncbi:MAG: glycosyltransferase [Gemmatimonadales bacterium]